VLPPIFPRSIADRADVSPYALDPLDRLAAFAVTIELHDRRAAVSVANLLGDHTTLEPEHAERVAGAD
jgi:hypothetical protein